jgi:hypothetical protein
VRFLVDEALQDLVADRLLTAGHDATHVRALGMQGVIDDDVLAHAAREQRDWSPPIPTSAQSWRCPAHPSPACCCVSAGAGTRVSGVERCRSYLHVSRESSTNEVIHMSVPNEQKAWRHELLRLLMRATPALSGLAVALVFGSRNGW